MRAWALLPPLLVLAATPCPARELRHTVAQHETLGDIARAYYGDPQRAEVIRLYNGLESSAIRSGSKLRVPMVDEHQVEAGDNWSGLALRYWGDASLHRALAEQAQGSPDAGLRVGQTLRIAPLIPYGLGPGETLVSVARRFYGDPERAGALARLNRVKDPRRLPVGAVLRVPLSERAPRPVTRPLPVASPPPKASANTFKKPLRRAINVYLDGRYDDALTQLEELRPKVLARGSRSEQLLLLEHLTFVYVAFDRAKDACDGYRALLQLEPNFRWNGDRVSPKILRLVATCQRG